VVERAEKKKSSAGNTEEGFLLLVTINGPIHFFMSSLYPQSHSSPPYYHKQLSGTSVALVCVFFVCLIGIAYLRAKAPRRTTRVLASSTARRLTARQRRPSLLEIWLDKHLDGTVHNWRVSHSFHLSTVESPTSRPPARTHTTLPPTVLPHPAPCRVAQQWPNVGSSKARNDREPPHRVSAGVDWPRIYLHRRAPRSDSITRIFPASITARFRSSHAQCCRPCHDAAARTHTASPGIYARSLGQAGAFL
jgi:hypothetical protein